MTCCRELDHSLNDLLIDSVSVPFDFPSLWKEVASKCASILQWEGTCKSDGAAQEMCNTVMDAYLLVYHLVSHPCNNTPLVKVNGKEIWEGQQIMAVYSLQGAIFEKHLLNDVMPAFSQASGGSTVQTYVRSWRSFLVAVVNIKTVFSSLADKWSLLGLEDNPLDRTEDIALRKWLSVVLSPTVVALLRRELRMLLADERAGHGSSDLSFAVEIKDELSILPDSSFYRTVVETDYIRDMCDYCVSKVRGVAERDIFAYAEQCLCLIEEEVKRAERFLFSKDHAVDRLVETLVDDHIAAFEGGKLSEWLDTVGQRDSDQKLQTVFRLLWWSKCKGVPLVEGAFKESVARHTSMALETAARTAGDGAGVYGALIESFAAIIRKYRDVVMTVFDYNGCMLEAMDDGLRCGFTSLRSVSFRRLADRLAALSNAILSNASSTQLRLEDVVGVYFFLPDNEGSAKDAFLVSYQKHLAKRLLLHLYDEASEQRAMEQLVQIKQSPVLFCCRSMLKATCSQTIYVGAASVNNVTVNPALLSRGMWPSLPHSLPSAGVSASVMKQIEDAQCMCSKRRHGQKIEFSAPYSSAVIRMRRPAGCDAAGDSVRLKVSFLQMCILDYINAKPQCTVQELCDRLQVSEAECTSALNPLVSATVLQVSEVGSSTPSVSLGACTGLTGDLVNVMPLEFYGLTHRTAANPSEQCASQSATKVNPLKMESQVIHTLKRDGPKTAEELMAHAVAVMQPVAVSRSELKRVLEKLIERGYVVRDESKRKFAFVP
ncbi:cullin 2 [Novymonas esmeraldas]|uniref:Cullin 2 n=1 Tax=Novymonas esmeraldas TaxID=1808958 RepID=A0AAW0EV20_9TRYP